MILQTEIHLIKCEPGLKSSVFTSLKTLQSQSLEINVIWAQIDKLTKRKQKTMRNSLKELILIQALKLEQELMNFLLK